MLSFDFIGGYVSANGSFIEYKRNNCRYHAFQLKTTVDNTSLLNQILASLEINNRVYTYIGPKQSYSKIIIRDRNSIINKLIPALEGRIFGYKQGLYIQWKQAINNSSSMWNFRNIKTTVTQK